MSYSTCFSIFYYIFTKKIQCDIDNVCNSSWAVGYGYDWIFLWFIKANKKKKKLVQNNIFLIMRYNLKTFVFCIIISLFIYINKESTYIDEWKKNHKDLFIKRYMYYVLQTCCYTSKMSRTFPCKKWTVPFHARNEPYCSQSDN